MSNYLRKSVFALLVLFVWFGQQQALSQNLLEESNFEKLSYAQYRDSLRYFNDVKWTGQGLQNKVPIDDIPTIELRARLQTLFGEPTKTVENVYDEGKFGQSAGATIQFEYVFLIDGKYPLTVMDINGPFANGLTYGGASRYVDLMPQIKRSLSRKLMNVDKISSFSDYFYSPEQEQWFLVQYEDGKFSHEEIKPPENMEYK